MPYTFTNVTEDHTIVAVFAENEPSVMYDVHVTPTVHGTVSVSPQQGYMGDTIAVTITPDAGYELDTLSFSPEVAYTHGVFPMPASDVTVTATFKEHQEEEDVKMYVKISGHWVPLFA